MVHQRQRDKMDKYLFLRAEKHLPAREIEQLPQAQDAKYLGIQLKINVGKNL